MAPTMSPPPGRSYLRWPVTQAAAALARPVRVFDGTRMGGMADSVRHAGRWTLEDRLASPRHYLPVPTEIGPGSAGLRVQREYERAGVQLWPTGAEADTDSGSAEANQPWLTHLVLGVPAGNALLVVGESRAWRSAHSSQGAELVIPLLSGRRDWLPVTVTCGANARRSMSVPFGPVLPAAAHPRVTVPVPVMLVVTCGLPL